MQVYVCVMEEHYTQIVVIIVVWSNIGVPVLFIVVSEDNCLIELFSAADPSVSDLFIYYYLFL